MELNKRGGGGGGDETRRWWQGRKTQIGCIFKAVFLTIPTLHNLESYSRGATTAAAIAPPRQPDIYENLKKEKEKSIEWDGAGCTTEGVALALVDSTLECAFNYLQIYLGTP